MLKKKTTKILCCNNEKSLTVNKLTMNKSTHFIRTDLYNKIEK